MTKRNNKLLTPQAQMAMDMLKAEIAAEFGVQMGADQSSRINGSIGGEMVKRLIKMAEMELQSQSQMK